MKLTSEECIHSLDMYHWEYLSTMTLEEMEAFMRRIMVENLDRYAPWRWIKVKKKSGHKPTEEEKKLFYQSDIHPESQKNSKVH